MLPSTATTYSKDYLARLQAAKLERNSRQAAFCETGNQEVNTTRLVVRVTSYRKRLLDEDNLCEKFLIDSLRYAGCIFGDEADKVKIETRQEKVTETCDERTVIEFFGTIDQLPNRKQLPTLRSR